MIHNTIIQSFNETTKVINCSIYKIDFKTFTYKFLNAKKTTKWTEFELVDKQTFIF